MSNKIQVLDLLERAKGSATFREQLEKFGERFCEMVLYERNIVRTFVISFKEYDKMGITATPLEWISVGLYFSRLIDMTYEDLARKAKEKEPTFYYNGMPIKLLGE